MITKTDFAAKLSSLNKKITKNKTDLLFVQNELNQPKTFDFSYLRGKNYFDESGTQNYYIFQSLVKYFKVAHINTVKYILSWKGRGLSDTTTESIKTSSYSLNPSIDY